MSLLVFEKKDMGIEHSMTSPKGARYENISDYFRKYDTGAINKDECIALVIWDDYNIIFNCWDSRYELTYKIFYDWLKDCENMPEKDSAHYCVYNRLYLYLKAHCPPIQTEVSQEALANNMDRSKVPYSDIPTKSEYHRTGVTKDYATYFTLFRRKGKF